MFEHKNKRIELISVFPYREKDKWFFRLIYQVENTENGEVKNIIIPKCANPFSESCLLRTDYDEEPTAPTRCYLLNEYSKIPLMLAHDDSIKTSKPYYYGEVIVKPATKEMTLKEIEKELGYKVKIKEDL